jgi:hypothetical protein
VLKTKYQHLHSGKLEFLALKWSITEQFRDYLYYSPKFTVFTDNNPLIYILTTAKLNATGLRWVGELSDFKFDIKYRPGRSNTDADSLYRLPGYFEEYMASCTQTISQKELDTSITIWLTSFTTDENMLGDDGAFLPSNASCSQIRVIDTCTAREQDNDQDVKRVREFIRSQQIPTPKERKGETPGWPDILPKDTLPKDILPKDILPNGHFADVHFAERTFCRKDVLPNGHFAERTVCRTDNLPKIEISSEL